MLGIIITYPTIWNEPIAWRPINEDYAEDKCYGIKQHWGGIDLYDCVSGDTYKSITSVWEAEWKPQREHCFWGNKYK